MIKLIQTELIKVFKHKSIYVIFIVMLLFCLLNNVLFMVDYNEDGMYKYEPATKLTKSKKELTKELAKYSSNKTEELSLYVDLKTQLDIATNCKKYSKNTWQYLKYYDYLYQDYYNINYYTYVEKNSQKLETSKNDLKKKLTYFNQNNYQYFLNEEIDISSKKLQTLNNSLKDIADIAEKKQIQTEIKQLEKELQKLKYRKNNSIDYSSTYLNRAFNTYQNLKEVVKEENYNKLKYEDKLEYNDNIKEMSINKYILDNKVNFSKENTLHYQLRTLVADYELFIVIAILLTSSIIIGEEFSKGTIKSLLIKPFSRNKILVAKLLASIIILLLTILILVLAEILIGGILLGFASLKIPMLVFDFKLNKLLEINIFKYIIIYILAKFPKYLILLLLNFSLNIIINSVISPFAITMLIYTFSEVINNIVVNNNVVFLKFLPTLNWDLSEYLFNSLNKFKYINFNYSITNCLIYVIIILVAMFINFNKKNIKNV